MFGIMARRCKLPLYLRNKREYFVLSIGNIRSLLIKNNSDIFNIAGFKKEMQEIKKYSEMSVLLWLDAISTYQRNALIKSRVSFIVPNSQIFAPKLGMCLKEFCVGKREVAEKISANTQYLLLYFIYQKKREEKKQSEIARYLNLSAMNASRAVRELQELGLVETRKEGTAKLIKPVNIGKELYYNSIKYLQSPMRKKIYMKCNFVDMNLPFAGETALAKQSMLNEPKHSVYAMDKKYVRDIPKEFIIEPKLVADDDYVEIELWKYNPCIYSVNGMVDIVSLAESLKEIEDERVEMQIEEVVERYEW